MRLNFYTLSSSALRPFWCALAIAFGLLATVDLAINVYVRSNTDRNRFIDSKDSKFLHLSMQEIDKPFDAIFIGSSKTKNHISTSVFRNHGINIYNLGISNRFLADFPSMVETAVSSGAKLIVLDITVDELFQPPTSNFVHADDLWPLLSTASGAKEMAIHLSAFLLSLHTLHYHREPIYLKIRSLLNRLYAVTPNKPDQIVKSVPRYENQSSIGIDCSVFKTDTYENMKVITCTNGDGAQLCKVDRKSENEKVSLDTANVNLDALRLLNRLIKRVEENAKVVVTLQPIWGRNIELDIESLRTLIKAPVVNLTSEIFSDMDWCDGHHFNIRGRQKYSTLLANRFVSKQNDIP